ncbi:MAG: exosortase/archaeosortase family protein, partial [Candidatus Hodarchaeota archaeon]
MTDHSESKMSHVSSLPPLAVPVQETSAKESFSQQVQFDGAEIILSFLAATVIAAAIYLIPEYFLLETLFRDLILMILQWLGVDAWATTQSTLAIPDPAISIQHYSPPPYGIVRACTAMQAGAIILALMVVTKAPIRKKIIAGITFCAMLFVANVLRIVFHLVLVSWGVPFWFAHDA